MEQDYRRKQIKSFLRSMWGYDEVCAKKTADQLNEARRVHAPFAAIVHNCTSTPNIDIRNFNFHELYLAKNLSWVIKRSVDIKPEAAKPANAPVELDAGSIEDSIQQLFGSDWYRESRENPFLVANVLKTISTRLLNDSVYRSQR